MQWGSGTVTDTILLPKGPKISILVTMYHLSGPGMIILVG